MREWLTVIIVLLIIGVVLDGLRRMRQSRRSAIRLSRNVTRHSHRNDPEAEPARETYGSELPRGGARVVNVRRPDDAKQFNQQLRENLHRKKRTIGRPYRIPEQVTLNLDEQVPTLMESVSSEAETETTTAQAHSTRERQPETDRPAMAADEDGRIEPSFSIDDGTLDDEENAVGSRKADDQVATVGAESRAARTTESMQRGRAFDRDTTVARNSFSGDISDKIGDNASDSTKVDYSAASEVDPYATGRADLVATDPTVGESFQSSHDDDSLNENEMYGQEDVDSEDEEAYREPDLVLVINVMAPQGERFDGESLLRVVLEQGMRFGTMNIFHRHEQTNGEGAILYSMANIVVPGTFDLNTMKQFSTPGVSLFQALPLEADSLDAFEKMLATARAITGQLGGELKDENRSVMTPQTIEHYRGRIREYERKQLSRAPA